MITLKNFSVFRSEAPIITQVSITFKPSSLVVLQGDNGAGKSSFAGSLMGLGDYTTCGELEFNGQDISSWSVEKRAQAGIFLSYQYPPEIPGLSLKTFLYYAYRSCKGNDLSLFELDSKIEESFKAVGLPIESVAKNVHEGFSGGQKKRFELAQILVLEPRVIILDELDSGLDSVGIQIFLQTIENYRKKYPEVLFFIITHNKELSRACNPDSILTVQAGKIVHA